MLNFEIVGNDIQTLKVVLEPGEIIKSEPGAMIYMQPGITLEGKIFDSGNNFLSKLGNTFKRVLSGESARILYYKNESKQRQSLALAPEIMGQIIPLQLEKNEPFYVQSGGYLASTNNVDISIEIVKNIGTGILGGNGFILQKLVGPGIIFINGFGNIQEIELNNETMLVDNNSLVAFSSGINYEIEFQQGLKNIFLSGEGLTNVKLSGTGTIYIQNTKFYKLAEKLSQYTTTSSNNNPIENITNDIFS